MKTALLICLALVVGVLLVAVAYAQPDPEPITGNTGVNLLIAALGAGLTFLATALVKWITPRVGDAILVTIIVPLLSYLQAEVIQPWVLGMTNFWPALVGGLLSSMVFKVLNEWSKVQKGETKLVLPAGEGRRW